jgi:hypothetical protein
VSRREFKYLLPTATLAALRRLILPHVELDPFAASRHGNEYTVRSLYLDTANLDNYHEKLAGLKDRMKIRIRGYNDVLPTSPVFLEIKRKMGSAVVKQRSMLHYRDLPALLETGDVERWIHATARQEEAKAHARLFLFHFHARALGPVITVAYDREPFFSRHDRALRITLDKNVRSHAAANLVSLNHEVKDLYAMPNRFILEVKTDFGIPPWLRLILSQLDVSREALSKYTICIDSLKAAGFHFELTHPWIMHNRRTSLETLT